MLTLLRRPIESVVALAARVVVRLSPGRSASAKLLSYWIGSRRVDETSDLSPGSDEGREALAFWFSLRDFVDGRINQTCEAYYDGRHPKHFLWREHNRYILERVREGDRVLDIGCGASAYPLWIAEKASEVLCVDVNPERVAEARSRNTSPKIRYEALDVERRLPEGRFDVAVCSHVLEHLDDPVALLRNLAKCADRIIVKVPLEDGHWMKQVRRDIGLPHFDDRDHRREYSEASLRDELTRAGWRVEDMVRGADLRAYARSGGRQDDVT